MTTQVERLARVEERLQSLTDTVDRNQRDADERLEAIDKKLDDLLALRNKGAGIIWLLGTGFIGGVYWFIDWLRG